MDIKNVKSPFISVLFLVASFTPLYSADTHTSLIENTSWPSFGGVRSGGQYSALNQINKSNVAGLERAWTIHTGDVEKGPAASGGSSFQATPVLWNDTLYVCTPSNRVLALNPESGEEVWTFNAYSVLPEGTPVFSSTCRGVAIWAQGREAPKTETCAARIIHPDVFGNLYALDAKTGALCNDFGTEGVLNLNQFDYFGTGGIFLASPPSIIGDTIVVGGGVADNMFADSADGIVRGLNVRTGEELWSFNPIPEGLRDKTGGANVWSISAVDEDAGIIYLPTSSPSVDPYGGARLADIPYANALVALDAATGRVIWHQQIIHHDVFDYDLPGQPILLDLDRDGERYPAVVQITKMGFIFVFNRETGEPLFDIEEFAAPATDVPGEQTAPTQPRPVKPAPFAQQDVSADELWGLTFWDRGKCRDTFSELRYDGLYTPPSLQGSLQLPSALGGGNWGGAAVDPITGVIIVKTQNLATIIKLVAADINEVRPLGPPVEFLQKPLNGTPYRLDGEFFLSPFGMPCTPPPWGELVAIDLNTGNHLWREPLGRIEIGPFKTPKSWGSPNVGGPIVTAGGLIFVGAGMDSAFHALDISTGKNLWTDSSIPAPAMAVPMTYMIDGVQYVVVAAGGNGMAGTKQSDAVIAYKLPQNSSK
ncbi:MAG: pyrroloquinoline quinone-dependent dehydrogenase [Rhodospirillaceae bacterium]|nr:pyrroloquinoline quinone-dependent dehydrogenase [Rhodospirillaceae bacterium]